MNIPIGNLRFPELSALEYESFVVRMPTSAFWVGCFGLIFSIGFAVQAWSYYDGSTNFIGPLGFLYFIPLLCCLYLLTMCRIWYVRVGGKTFSTWRKRGNYSFSDVGAVKFITLGGRDIGLRLYLDTEFGKEQSRLITIPAFAYGYMQFKDRLTREGVPSR